MTYLPHWTSRKENLSEESSPCPGRMLKLAFSGPTANGSVRPIPAICQCRTATNSGLDLTLTKVRYTLGMSRSSGAAWWLLTFVANDERAGAGVVSSVGLALANRQERRAWARFSVAVPAFISVGNQDFTAKLANIVRDGAMLETTAPLNVGKVATVRCGTITATATVVWKESHRVGVRFLSPLTDAEVEEQLSRSTAMAARRSAAGK